MQHRAHRRDREVGHQVFGVVPHERGNPLVPGNTEAAQRICQLASSLPHIAIATVPIALTRRGGDRASPVDTAAVAHDRGDRQRKVLHRAVHRCTALRVSARLMSSSGECYRREKS